MAKRQGAAAQVIGFRLTPPMVKKLDAIAAKAGRTRANYLRMLLSEVIARGGLAMREI